MQPSFGVQLRSKLFEPLDSFLLNGIKEDIRETIAIYDKRIRITSLLVEEDVSLRSRGLNKIYIKLSFVIKDFPTFVDTLEITI
jgi:phage baseplate assembly protein W